MKPFAALYRKELKLLAGPFFVLVVIHIAGILYLLLTDVPAYGESWSFASYAASVQEHYAFLNVFMYGSICLIPFLLGYSYYEDWNDRTSLQLLSIPAARSAVSWAKYAAAMTVGLFIPAGLFIYRLLFDLKVNPHIALPNQPVIVHMLFACFMFCVTAWIVSVISVSAGVMASLYTHRLTGGIAAFVVLSAVTWGVLYLVDTSLLSAGQGGLSEPDVFSFSAAMIRGGVLILGGLLIQYSSRLLFERYVEA